MTSDDVDEMADSIIRGWYEDTAPGESLQRVMARDLARALVTISVLQGKIEQLEEHVRDVNGCPR
jgi:hypothetical protein